MELKIKVIDDKELWESFIKEQDETPFFQSWAWGEVQKNIGFSIMRLGLFAGGKLLGISMVVKITAKRGRYYHLRHGPLLARWNWEWFDQLIDYVKRLGKQEGVAFIRISPLLDEGTEVYAEFRKRGFKNSPIHNMDGEVAWILNLDRSEDELLQGMRKTTRYLIRKAQKMGVRVEEKDDPESLQVFLRLYQDTARRHKFVTHRGIREEFELFKTSRETSLYLASYNNQVLAASLIIFYGNQAVYHHSGTDPSQADVPASYLLQWKAICEAKRRKLLYYNFWGIAPVDKPQHPWRGLSLFKMGFGGRLVRHLHAQDLPLSLRYTPIYALETLFRIKKGY